MYSIIIIIVWYLVQPNNVLDDVKYTDIVKIIIICLNEHVLNKYSVRTRYFRESRSMRAEYKRGVVRPEVLDHAHKYGG